MKRSMELVRSILLAMEESPVECGREALPLRVDGYSPAVLCEHLVMMTEAGLIKPALMDDLYHPVVDLRLVRMTWAGHDFLDEARNETMWNKAMAKVKEAGVGATVDILKTVLKNLATQAIGG